MAQRTASLGGMAGWALLGALLSLSPAKSQRPSLAKCNLEGMWINDLGSQVYIGPVDAAGHFSGYYLAAVSAATDAAIRRSPLYGSQKRSPPRDRPTFGWVVNWSFYESTTVFAGQCFVDANGEEFLEAMWLLREEAPTHADNWKATRVGKNVYVRVK